MKIVAGIKAEELDITEEGDTKEFLGFIAGKVYS